MTCDNVKKMIDMSLEKKEILVEILRLTKAQGDNIEKDVYKRQGIQRL